MGDYGDGSLWRGGSRGPNFTSSIRPRRDERHDAPMIDDGVDPGVLKKLSHLSRGVQAYGATSYRSPKTISCTGHI